MRFLECKGRILDVVDSEANINFNLLYQETILNKYLGVPGGIGARYEGEDESL